MRDLTAADALLRDFEKGPDNKGPALKAYTCPSGKWTIGYGHTKDVCSGLVITAAEAEHLLRDDIALFSAEVARVCLRATGAQHAALVCFAFNYGKWAASSVVKAHNRGDYIAAARAFAMVNKGRNAEGKLVELRGLTRRRAAEAMLYMSDDGLADAQRTRSAETTGESRLAASKTVAGAITTVASGLAAVAPDVAKQLTDAKDMMEPLVSYSDGLRTIFICLAIAAGIAVLTTRYLDRRAGRH